MLALITFLPTDATRVFTDALRLELNRVDPNDKDKRKKINRLAEKLVECAIEASLGVPTGRRSP
jgi:hypothetical protein